MTSQPPRWWRWGSVARKCSTTSSVPSRRRRWRARGRRMSTEDTRRRFSVAPRKSKFRSCASWKWLKNRFRSLLEPWHIIGFFLQLFLRAQRFFKLIDRFRKSNALVMVKFSLARMKEDSYKRFQITNGVRKELENSWTSQNTEKQRRDILERKHQMKSGS